MFFPWKDTHTLIHIYTRSYYRELVDEADNILGNLLKSLTSGLGDISGQGIPAFDGGPLNNIRGVLDKFDLSFDDLIDGYLKSFSNFTTDASSRQLNQDADLQELLKFKPSSLPKFPNLLQLGSKKPSVRYSPNFKRVLFRKLVKTFPASTYNGISIPGLELGKSLLDTFSDDGADFPVDKFLPLIAVAFGYSPNFSNQVAIEFTMDRLFEPEFGPSINLDFIKTIKDKLPDFDTFSTTDPDTQQPMNPITLETFEVFNYLPELQLAYDFSPSLEFGSPNFKSSDLFPTLFPDQLPTISGLKDYTKRKIIPQLLSKLGGLFDVEIDTPSIGLTSSNPSLGDGGLQLGEFSDTSTRLFPPTFDLDSVQGFSFDINVDVGAGPSVSN